MLLMELNFIPFINFLIKHNQVKFLDFNYIILNKQEIIINN